MSRRTPKSKSRRDFVKHSVATGLAAAIGTPLSKAFGATEVLERPDQFDYIIVGSGPGGGPLAVNLAKAGYKVLVLEAGGAEKPHSTLVPAMHPQSTEEKGIVWKYYVKFYSDLAQQMRNSNFDKQRGGVQYPRGATLGGSSAINALITMYPDNSDWENLVRVSGSSDYAPEEMRRIFQRLERNNYRLPGWDNQHVVSRNGYQGWLPTSMTSMKFLFQDRNFVNLVTAAAREAGLWRELNDKIFNILGMDLDPNSWPNVYKGREGIFTPPKNTEKGVRWGLREHLMDAAAKYPKNLVIRTNSLATRVLFADGQESRAIGVACVSGRGLYKADPDSAPLGAIPKETEFYARKEVILAGGAFNSPQLLMLSGIGDREHLNAMGIATRVNLPGVGRNLQDRHELGVVSKIPGGFKSLADCKFDASAADACFEDLKEHGKNAIYSSNGVLIGLKKRSFPDRQDPDLFIFAVPGEFKGYYEGWSKNANRPETYTWAILKGHTRNTAGNVQLRSKHPFDTPEINFRFFDDGKALDGEDMASVLQAMKIARSINAKMSGGVQEVSPGASVESDDQLKQFIKDETWGHHASCTNKMGANGLGPGNGEQAVVDAEFRVYGTKGLRVVDASVFPKIPGLFIALPIYMMSEKASDIILRDAKKA